MRIAIDTGGTFTDCVCLADGKLRVKKIFSTPADPSRAVLDGVRELGGGKNVEVRHGTTVGTNTMLERTGARVAFVTTAGFEDTIAIGRQARARLYDWFAPAPECLVMRELRFGVAERVSAEGEILREPTDDELAVLVEAMGASGAEAVAISLLFSFANPKTERRVEAALRDLRIPVSASHRILPEFREYERASTTVVNAYLAPRMEHYLSALEERVGAEHEGGRVDVMQSSGGIVAARVAAEEPVRTVLSGPAGGVVGACCMAQWAGFDKIIGFDMGGTSTDVFVANVATGAELTCESIVAGVPIGVPMLDIHTAGAGGGSLARFDAGGMLRVGPESAGAEPGPICFGRGEGATVTDANFVLGRLDAESFLGGRVELERERTLRLMGEQKGGLDTVEDFAAGIVRVVETQMEKAIRVISVERGHDPRDFTLVAFGGGGPLHACSLARALRIPRVLVPALPGALSAVGILLADTVRDFSRTVMIAGDAIENVGEIFSELEKQGAEEFAAEGLNGVVERSVDLRYRGQGYELNVRYDPQAPEGSIVNARPPAAVAGGNVETSQRIVDVLMRALAKAVPERIPAASAGTMSNVTIGGVDRRAGRGSGGGTGEAFAYYETAAGGMGARPGMDGISGVHTHMTNSLNTPVEALEYTYPFRVRRYGYRYGSGGEGKFRGGDGLIREVELLCDAEVTLLADRRNFRPYGLEGGGDGAAGRAVVVKAGTGEEIELPGKCSRQLKRGDVLRIETPGGGGWGKARD